jgi:hypothetical protein
MDIPGERIVHMDGCDHRSICRFSDKTGNSYRCVLGVLKPWAKEARRGMLYYLSLYDDLKVQTCVHIRSD